MTKLASPRAPGVLRALGGGLMLALVASCAAEPPEARDPGQAPAPTVLPMPGVGDQAPEFTLPDTSNNPVSLGDFRGKSNVVLAFFVLAFTGG